jgi:hypothetical protein
MGAPLRFHDVDFDPRLFAQPDPSEPIIEKIEVLDILWRGLHIELFLCERKVNYG